MAEQVTSPLPPRRGSRGDPLAARRPAAHFLTAMSKLAHLPERAVLEVSGDDRVSFLQGLVSNDVAEAAPGRAVWAALLTPQGKYLADFFILADGARLLLDCDAGQAAMLAPRLARFRLRAPGRDRARTVRGLCRLGRHARPAGAGGTRPAAARGRLSRARRSPTRRQCRCRRLGPPPARPRAARAARSGGGEIRAAGGRLRRTARRVLGQGLLHGPGTHGANQVSRPGQAPAGAGRGRGRGCPRPAPRSSPRVGRSARCARGGSGWAWRCCGSTQSASRSPATAQHWCRVSRTGCDCRSRPEPPAFALFWC